jgi:hypothetical protein
MPIFLCYIEIVPSGRVRAEEAEGARKVGEGRKAQLEVKSESKVAWGLFFYPFFTTLQLFWDLELR